MMWSNALVFCLVFIWVSGEPEPNVNVKINVNVNGETEVLTEPGASCQCGIASTERIIGGSEVNPKRKYPWMVGLMQPGNTISCGGTIVNDRWILTAAHCVTVNGCEISDYPTNRVLVGEHNQDEGDDDVTDTKQYKIKTYIIHPSYSCGGDFDYDFALLELTEAIPFKSVIKPICLPKDDSNTYAGQTGIVTGWGLTAELAEGGNISKYMKEKQVSIYANDDCKNWGPVSDFKLCSSNGFCSGDSGGPLHVIENGKYVQVGVFSYTSEGCTDTEYPTVFGRVSSSNVLTWITSTTANGKKCD